MSAPCTGPENSNTVRVGWVGSHPGRANCKMLSELPGSSLGQTPVCRCPRGPQGQIWRAVRCLRTVWPLPRGSAECAQSARPIGAQRTPERVRMCYNGVGWTKRMVLCGGFFPNPILGSRFRPSQPFLAYGTWKNPPQGLVHGTAAHPLRRVGRPDFARDVRWRLTFCVVSLLGPGEPGKGPK